MATRGLEKGIGQYIGLRVDIGTDGQELPFSINRDCDPILPLQKLDLSVTSWAR